MTGCEVTGGVWVCTLSRPNGSKARIVWLEKEAARQWNPPADWHVSEAQTLDGKQLGGNLVGLQLGQAPIYLS